MKTKKTVLTENSEHKNLINAVVDRIGMESINDVNQYGIDGGFSGFIYYSETNKFAIIYRKEITQLLDETADMLGEDVVSMVASFGVFRRSPMDADDKRDLYKYLGGGNPGQGIVTNVLAWFAAETVCRMFDE